MPTSVLSVKTALIERFLGQFTGMDAVSNNDVHRDICKTQLTQNLGMFRCDNISCHKRSTDNIQAALLPRMKAVTDAHFQQALDKPGRNGK